MPGESLKDEGPERFSSKRKNARKGGGEGGSGTDQGEW